MNRQARALLYYFARYLQHDPQRRKRLVAFYQKTTRQRLHRKTLWGHVKMKKEPTMGMTLIYLAFLHREKAIVCSESNRQLFLYPYFDRAGNYAEPVRKPIRKR